MSFDHAFAELRPALFALAYRITGNRADAEEIVQDTFVRLHDAGAKDTVRSLKAYLATITARLSFNRLRDQRARRESYVGEWLPEPLMTEGDPTVRAEDVSFALLVVLERLSPAERVVFVLRHAFDLPFEEIAPVVGRDIVTCRKIFSRARARVAEARPRFAVDRERHRALMQKFIEAARGEDMNGLLVLLDENVVLHGDGGGKAFRHQKTGRRAPRGGAVPDCGHTDPAAPGERGGTGAQWSSRPGGAERRTDRGSDHDRHGWRPYPFDFWRLQSGQARSCCAFRHRRCDCGNLNARASCDQSGLYPQ